MVSNLLKHSGNNNRQKQFRQIAPGCFYFHGLHWAMKCRFMTSKSCGSFLVCGKASFNSNQALGATKSVKRKQNAVLLSQIALLTICVVVFFFLLCCLMMSIRGTNRLCCTLELLFTWKNSQVVINMMSWLHFWKHTHVGFQCFMGIFHRCNGYAVQIVFSISLSPKFSKFFDFEKRSLRRIYKLVSLWGPKKCHNLLVLLSLLGHLNLILQLKTPLHKNLTTSQLWTKALTHTHTHTHTHTRAHTKFLLYNPDLPKLLQSSVLISLALYTVNIVWLCDELPMFLVLAICHVVFSLTMFLFLKMLLAKQLIKNGKQYCNLLNTEQKHNLFTTSQSFQSHRIEYAVYSKISS